MIELDAYDAGCFSDWGGGNVEWWQDYIRAELARAHEFYQSQLETTPTPVIRAEFRTEADGVTGTTSAQIDSIEQQDDGSFMVVINHWPTPAPVSDITEEMVERAIEASGMSGWDHIEERMRDALTAALKE